MTRENALDHLRRLAHGLDLGEESRLLERVAAHDGAEELRDALTDLGACILLVVASAEIEAIRGAVEAVGIIASGECETLGHAESLAARALVAAESPLSPGRVQPTVQLTSARHGVPRESRVSAGGVNPCAVNLDHLSVDHQAGGSE